MTETEKAQFVDMIAQAVVERIEQREQVNRLAESIIERVQEIQKEEREIAEADEKTKGQSPSTLEKNRG